jgi:hypothetical protein
VPHCSAFFFVSAAALLFPLQQPTMASPAERCASELTAFNRCLMEVRLACLDLLRCCANRFAQVCAHARLLVQSNNDISACQWTFDSLRQCQSERL